MAICWFTVNGGSKFIIDYRCFKILRNIKNLLQSPL